MLNSPTRPADGSLVLFANSPLWSPIEHYAPAAKLWRPAAAAGRHVAFNDPAVHILTDFTREHPITVTEDRPIDEALRDMMTAGVRALLVVRGDIVSGLITSYDIQGERPLQFLQDSSYTRHDEIEVGHIMTPWDLVPKVNWSWLGVARVRDVAELFSGTGATHMLVLEHVDHNGTFVRGLLSSTRLNRQLGQDLGQDG